MARTADPSDLATPASCTGQADQTGNAGGARTWARPTDRFPRQPERCQPNRKSGRDPGHRPTRQPSQDPAGRAGSTDPILPADSACIEAARSEGSGRRYVVLQNADQDPQGPTETLLAARTGSGRRCAGSAVIPLFAVARILVVGTVEAMTPPRRRRTRQDCRSRDRGRALRPRCLHLWPRLVQSLVRVRIENWSV